MSYNGHLGFGLLGDYDALPDLEGIATHLERSIAALARAASAGGTKGGAKGAAKKPRARKASKPQAKRSAPKAAKRPAASSPRVASANGGAPVRESASAG